MLPGRKAGKQGWHGAGRGCAAAPGRSSGRCAILPFACRSPCALTPWTAIRTAVSPRSAAPTGASRQPCMRIVQESAKSAPGRNFASGDVQHRAAWFGFKAGRTALTDFGGRTHVTAKLARPCPGRSRTAASRPGPSGTRGRHTSSHGHAHQAPAPAGARLGRHACSAEALAGADMVRRVAGCCSRMQAGAACRPAALGWRCGVNIAGAAVRKAGYGRTIRG